MPDPAEASDSRWAWFPGDAGALRKIPPGQLPAHEPAWAMTVHKSQGSEFDRALFILPPEDIPLLTRELVYTAITRCRSGVEIWCEEQVFASAVARRIERVSGLPEALARF